MGSSGGGDYASSYYQQQQQLALQREQMALSQRQHQESLALQKAALDKPVAGIQKNVSLATQEMVADQQTAKNNLKGIRSTYSMFAKQAEDDDGGNGSGAKLGS